MDKLLGDILDKFEDMGIVENILIIFLGDNGGDVLFGDVVDYGLFVLFKGKKGLEYEGGVCVFFIVSWVYFNLNNKF